MLPDFDWDIEVSSAEERTDLTINTDVVGRPLHPLYPEHIVKIFKLMDTWLVELVDGKTYSCKISPSSDGIVHLKVNAGFDNCVGIKISVKEVQELIEGGI